MRGTRAKRLRELAIKTMADLRLQKRKPKRIRNNTRQAMTSNTRYLYQAMKGRRALKVQL